MPGLLGSAGDIGGGEVGEVDRVGPETGPHIAKAVSNTFSQPDSIASTTTPASYTLFPLVFAFITGMIGMYGIHQN